MQVSSLQFLNAETEPVAVTLPCTCMKAALCLSERLHVCHRVSRCCLTPDDSQNCIFSFNL